MTILREAAQMALDALEQCVSTCLDQYSHEQVMSRPEHFMNQAMGALRAALAQPEPEPFEYFNAVEGWVKIEEVRQHFDTAGCGTIYKTSGEGRVPLYTAPQREWVGLTNEDYEAMAEKYVTNCYFDTLKYARAIEAKLRDKNS